MPSKQRGPSNDITFVSIGVLLATHCFDRIFDFRFSMLVTTTNYEINTGTIDTPPRPIDGDQP